MTSTHNQRGIGRGLQETVEIPANAEAPGAARVFLRDQLGDDFEPGRLHDLDLIMTELVTNAVQHGSNPGDGITLDLRRRRSTIHVGVTDHCRKRTSPTLLTFSGDRESGRGLMTVERLADQWGDEIVSGQRRVWATVTP